MPEDSASPVEVPQAVEQAAAVEQEDAQRIAKEAAAAVAAAGRELEKDDGVAQKGGADLESALQVDPEHGDSPVALIDARYIVELWKRGGKILRRQDSKGGVSRPRDGQEAASGQWRLPARHRRLAPVAAARPSRPEGGQPHATRKGTRAIYRGRSAEWMTRRAHLRLFL